MRTPADTIAARFSHCSRVVKEGGGDHWAIQTREPEGRWRRYSGGFASESTAAAALDEYYACGWFPVDMRREPTVRISFAEACRSTAA